METSLNDRWSCYAAQAEERRPSPRAAVAPMAPRKLAALPVVPSKAFRGEHQPKLPLTVRETIVVKRLSEGATVGEIACELGVSNKTVEYFSHRARRKIGTMSIALLTRWAIVNGLSHL